MIGLSEQLKSQQGDRPGGLELRRWDLAVIPLLAALLALGLWRLTEAPANVTGDEVTFLNDILKIFYSPDKLNPLSLMGDGSKAGIDLYTLALVARLFPEDQLALGIRAASVMLGIASLGAFYLYLRNKTAQVPALCAVLLLGTNYVFLNISRSTWMGDGKGVGLTFGLLSFLLVGRGTSRGRWAVTALGGAAGGIALYSYFGTAFLPAASLVYFLYLALRRRLNPTATLVHASVFAVTALIVFLPNLWSIWQNYDTYTLRSRTVYVEMTDDPSYRAMDTATMVWHQITYTARGFFLFDPAVTGTGPENARYSPAGEAPIDAVTEGLFFLAIPTALFLRRRDLAQPVIAFGIMLIATQILTVYPPNYSRGIFALPFIYLLVALLLDTVWSVRQARRYMQFGMVLVVVAVSAWNVQHYFEWNATTDLAEARQPAIEYSQVPLWIATEKQLIAKGDLDLVITTGYWQQVLQKASAGQQSP